MDTHEEIKAHLKHCKERAFEVLEKTQNPADAWTSFLSDMSKNENTKNHSAIGIGGLLLLGGNLSTTDAMKKFIDGFN